MKRILGILITLAVLAVASPAFAGKPSIAILGLEIVDDGSMDAKATQFAEALTEALRQRARAGTGPFALAPGSDKNLIEMKLLSGCESEANACMAAIGAELAADRLLYGKVEKRSNGYQVSLKLLNVETKSAERSTTEVVPFGEASGAALTNWGKKLYAKITGATTQGTLVVKANVDAGTVFLDGEARGNIVGGTARITGLDAGDYKLAVEADCYLRHEGKVTVEGGKDATQKVDLEKNALAACAGGDIGPGGGG
ncbi:MAG: PEGA domain-containing protein, partial [Kofleriaceae bacterium]